MPQPKSVIMEKLIKEAQDHLHSLLLLCSPAQRTAFNQIYPHGFKVLSLTGLDLACSRVERTLNIKRDWK